MKKILVPTDFSDCARAAYEYAVMMAEELDASLELLHVWSLPTLATTGDVLIAVPDQPYQTATDWVEREAGEALEQFAASVRHGNVPVKTSLTSGRAEETIVAAAKEGGFEMIVMGTHGRSGMSHLLLGSVAERVVRLAPCPVVTVKADGAEPKTAGQSAGATSSV